MKEVKPQWLLMILFVGLCTTRLFWFAPEGYFDPFPYYNILNENGENVGIAYKTYWHYMGLRLFQISWWIFLWCQVKWAYEGRWLFWLWVGGIVDYCLRYSQEFITVFGVGVNYTDLLFLVFFSLVVRRIKLEIWRQER